MKNDRTYIRLIDILEYLSDDEDLNIQIVFDFWDEFDEVSISSPLLEKYYNWFIIEMEICFSEINAVKPVLRVSIKEEKPNAVHGE